tara:strand:+ start:35 stop:1075 length:1041 start_codon:yes stop_codon:yes gene_type:complete
MSSVYGSSILNLDLVLDYNNLTNKPTIPQVGYTTNGTNYAVQLLLDKMFVSVPAGDITVATSNALGGLKIGYTENGTNYALKLDGDNEAFVTVPTPAITVATSNDLGGLKIGYTENGTNYALKLDGDNEAFVTVPTPTINAANASTLGSIKIGYTQNGNNYAVQLDGDNEAFVNVPKTILPTPDAILGDAFILTADQNINGNNNTTFIFEDENKGASATTVYPQGITHTNNTNVFTVSTAGQYLISYFLHENNTPGGNARLYGYSCIRRENSNGGQIYEYTMGGEYLRNNGTQDDIVISGTAPITFNAGDRFKIRFYRLYSQNTDDVLVRRSLSNLRIERVNYTAT